MASQVVAGEGVEDAAAQEGGADQDEEDVKHGDVPGSSATAAACGRHVALHID